MGAEAGADERELSSRGIVDREVTAGTSERKQLGRRMARPRLANVRVVGRAYRGGEPHATALIEHWVVHVGLTGPDELAAPIGRWLQHLRPGGRRGVGIAHGERYPAGGVVRGIEHGEIVGAQFERSVE